MDAIELLKADHEAIHRVFDQCDQSNDRSRIENHYYDIKNLLISNMDIKESIFYPTFQKYPELVDFIENAYQEQTDIRNTLTELDRMLANSENITAPLLDLREAVLHHFQDEDQDLFPQVRKLMRRPEREQLGRHLKAARQEKRAA